MSEFRASRLPKHRGTAAWNEILGRQSAPRILDADRTADFVVIGGGFAGLSAARRLRQLHVEAEICVLEAGRIGEGASGRNSGFMIDLPHDLASSDYAGRGSETDRQTIGLNRQAIAFAKEAVETYGIPPDFFDPVGKVNAAVGEKGGARNAAYSRHLRILGEPHEMLDAASMKELTGSGFYRSGLYTPGTVMIQPAGYVRGLSKGLSPSVDIFENSPVTGFARIGSSWRVSTSKAKLDAGMIVVANNGHLESLGFLRNRLMHVFLFASMTTELNQDTLKDLGGQPRWGVIPADPMGTTVRRIDKPLGGNRIVTRTCASFHPNMVPTRAEMNRAASVHLKKLEMRLPTLKGCPMQYRWAGHLCLSRNDVSVVREVEPGVFTACCQNGLGTVRGTLTGIAAAEMASETSTPISEYFASQEQPSRLPPRPLAGIGANLYLRWKEWAAGAE